MIKFVNFRASDIEPNPNEVLYWVDLNEDPTGGSIKYWNEKGYWLTIRVLEGTLNEFEERITKWVTEELQEQTEWVEDLVHQFDGRIAIIEGDILNLYIVKLDKLIPGYGIEITEDNTINCTVDLSLYKVVAELPTEDIDESKIYIVFDPDGTGTNTHEEYVYVDGKWELLGKYADYASITELQLEIADRKAADQQLQLNIDAEIERATNKETVLLSAITKEISDRLSEITRVEQLINDESQTILESITLTNQAISEEVDRAIAAELKLTQDLNAEILRSTTTDETHANKLSALETKDTELEEEIDAEVSRATAKETELNEAITNEISRATLKESEIETSLDLFKSTKGQNSGLASLDENGRVPSAQLPSYVDDVVEADTLTAFPETGESGKIYIAKDTNKTYRWSGTDYTEISASLALGETSSTAYAGDKGKANRDALLSLPDTIVGGNANNITFSYDSTNVSLRYNYTTKSEMNYTLASSPSIRPINAATTTTAGVMTAADKAKLDGISSGANVYTHPAGSAPSKPVGLYKISTDANSHIASTTAVTKADITALGIPGSDTNTTYTFANGTDGSFTVTPSGGSALKVTIGKPATAGTADTANAVAWSGITSKPTTITGYGITDAVKKTGGTMTGILTINNNIFPQLTIQGAPTAYITYKINDKFAHVGYVQNYGILLLNIDNFINITDEGAFLINNLYAIYHTGNLSPVTTNTELTITGRKIFLFTDAPTCYVLKNTSDYSSYLSYEDRNGLLGYLGILSTTREPFFQKGTTELAYKIWHEGNDGSGSGLDADTVDGIHASSFALTTSKLANPYALTFTGAVTGTYDGSAAKTVNIPTASTRASLGIDTDDAVVFAKVTASGGFWKESDKRLKSNIKPLEHTIEQITSIPTVEFDMNDKHQIGTIAQDIETVVPEVVSESDGIKKVEYSMMGVLAIEGIKLLKQEIEDLKKEIELLKNK